VDIHLSRLVVLVLLTVAAAGYDIVSRTIPNWLTAAGLLGALALAAMVGMAELGLRVLAALVVLAASLPLFARGILGGGDVKLLVALAALVGFARLPEMVLFACIAGAVIALAEAVRRGFFLPLMLDARDVVVYYLTFGRHGRRVPETHGARLTVPYGVAIGVGALAAWFR
jgi:prepilin peptidase CpaA